MKKVFFSLLVMVGFVTANAQTDSLQQYTGKYTFPDGSPADVYEVVAFGGTATFKRKEGKVTGVQILVGDVNIEGTKSESGAYIPLPLFML